MNPHVVDAATEGCILRAAGETQRHKNLHSVVPHEQLVPTAGLTILPGWSGSGESWYTGAGSRRQVLVLTGAETRHTFSSGARTPECTTERRHRRACTGDGTGGRARRRSAPRPAARRKGPRGGAEASFFINDDRGDEPAGGIRTTRQAADKVGCRSRGRSARRARLRADTGC